MEVVVTTGAISRAKLQSNHHHQQTNIVFLQAGCPSCRPTNSVKALKGNDTYKCWDMYLGVIASLRITVTFHGASSTE